MATEFRILQIGKFYPIKGGVEKMMLDLTVGLSKKNIYCDMLCVNSNNEFYTFKINEFYKIIAVNYFLKFASTYFSFQKIFWLRRNSKKYTIIHIHHPDPMAAIALLLSNFKGKIVLHWHSDIVKQKFLLKLYKPVQNLLLKRCDVIIGTTPTYLRESDHLINYLNKSFAIPIGINPLDYQINKDRLQQIRAKYFGKKIVFSLGRFVYYKGFEYLIDAAQYIDSSIIIIIGGSGPLFVNFQKQIAHLGIADKIELVGYIKQEDVATYFAASHVYVMSSIERSEAFGISMIEAMMFGKPIVSTNIKGSGVSWVNQTNLTGLEVEPRDSKAIATAINTIMSDKALHERMSNNSKVRFNELFHIDIMVQNIFNMYNVLS